MLYLGFLQARNLQSTKMISKNTHIYNKSHWWTSVSVPILIVLHILQGCHSQRIVSHLNQLSSEPPSGGGGTQSAIPAYIHPNLVHLGPQLRGPRLALVQSSNALPAKQGTEFEGPDPGLNAAIISAPEVCPNNYMKDAAGKCRPSFTYGPNPHWTFSPEKFKGSIQFYMDLKVGRPHVNRRRFFLRNRNGTRRGGGAGGRFHVQNSTGPRTRAPQHLNSGVRSTASIPPVNPVPGNLVQPTLPPPVLIQPTTQAPTSSILPQTLAPVMAPTPPSLTGTVAEITALLELYQNEDVQQEDLQQQDQQNLESVLSSQDNQNTDLQAPDDDDD